MSNTAPTAERLSVLPRWALVAFSAHCARKLRNLYDDTRDNGVDFAIEAAELAAANALPISDPESIVKAIGLSRRTIASRVAYHAAMAAYHAAMSATSLEVPGDRRAAAVSSFCQASGVDVRGEFAHLLNAATSEGWTDNTPIPVSVFDSMPADEAAP